MLATALGLLGCTPGEVTDGQPFLKTVQSSHYPHGTVNAHLAEIQLLSLAVLDEPVEISPNDWPGLFRCEES